MHVGDYEFIGIYTDPNHISKESGVFVVIDVVDGEPARVLDIGCSGACSNLHDWICDHRLIEWWYGEAEGTVGYLLRYTENSDEIDDIIDELTWQFTPPCGSHHWDRVETFMREYKEMEERFGERGPPEVTI